MYLKLLKQGLKMCIFKAGLLLLYLVSLFSGSLAQSTEVTDLPPVWSTIENQYGCAAPGVYTLGNLQPYNTEKMDNAKDCFDKCFRSYKDATRGVVFFENSNFRGHRHDAAPRRYNAFKNDQVSRVVVFPCYKVKLYEHSRFRGKTVEYDARYSQNRISVDLSTVGFNDKTSSYQIWERDNSFCRSDDQNLANGKGKLCTRWAYDAETEQCSLYSSNIRPKPESMSFNEHALIGSFSGVTNCNKVFSRVYYTMAASKGCATRNGRVTGTPIRAVVRYYAPMAKCRSLCQDERRCQLFTYDLKTKYCRLYDNSASYYTLAGLNHIYAGAKYCSTCPPGTFLEENSCVDCQSGFYCPGGNDKKACPVGNICPGIGNIAPTPCEPGKLFCPYEEMTQGLSQCTARRMGPKCDKEVMCIAETGDCDVGCYGFKGDGLCSGCSEKFAGRICEHRVCSNSELAKNPAILETYNKKLSEFNFLLYNVEQLSVEQVAVGQNTFGLRVSFIPVTADVEAYGLSIDGIGTPLPFNAGIPKCDQNPVSFPDHEFQKIVGSTLTICVKSFWYSERQKLVNGYWTHPEGSTLLSRPEPEACVEYTMQFQTRVKIYVRDLYKTVKIDGVRVRFQIGDEDFTATSENGLINKHIVLPGVAKSTTDLSFKILAVEPGMGEADFRICRDVPALPAPGSPTGVACMNIENISSVETRVSHQGETLEVLIIDQLAVEVSGRVKYDTSSQACGIENVTIIAIDTRGDERELLRVTTNANGEFQMAVARGSKIRLELDYNEHDFVGDEVVSKDIMKTTGLEVTAANPRTGLMFTDKTTRKITVTVAVTECMYPITSFTLELKGCAGASVIPSIVTSGQTTKVLEAPAHAFDYDLNFESSVSGGEGAIDAGTIKKQFEYVFPVGKRQIDLTIAEEVVKFIYHPLPVVTMEVQKGRFDVGTYAATKCPDPAPFKYMLTGNSAIQLRYSFSQEYKYKEGSEEVTVYCRHMPEGTQLVVLSNLREDRDPCSSLGEGCVNDINLELFRDRNISLSRVIVVAGQPSDVVVDITSSVNNSKIWDPTLLSSRKDYPEKVIILGNKVLSADSIVTFFDEEQGYIPLLYVYAPPGAHQGNSQSVELDLAVTTTTQMYSNARLEAGGGVSVGLKATYEGEICIPFSGCPIKTSNVEAEASVGLSALHGRSLFFTDDVQTVVNSSALKLETASGIGPDADLVLVVTTTAKFIKARYFSYDYSKTDACKVKEQDSITWGSEVKSMSTLTRTTIESSISKLEDTIRIDEPNIDNEDLPKQERLKAERRVQLSKNSITHFASLFEHWENDRREARKRPVAVGGGVTGGGGPSRINYGAAGIELTRTVMMSDSSVLDYQSTSTIVTTSAQTSFEALVGVDFLVGPTGSAYAEVSAVSETLFSKTREEATTMNVVATFAENDRGDELCIDVFESPHSKTYVFEVCGGETRCPHVPGTDPRESILMTISKRPAKVLSTDTGVFELSFDISDSRVDEITVIIELDGAVASAPVAFSIGASSLNQPLTFTYEKGALRYARIFFERLDPSVQQITIGGSVRSACDDSIQSRFGFTVNWASSCPAVSWGDDLEDPGEHFKLTRANPVLALTAINPLGVRWSTIEGVDVKVSLWARLYKPLTSEWFRVDNKFLRIGKDSSSMSSSFEDKQDESGFATLYLSPERALFRDGERYLLELRADCTDPSRGTALGQTRSGARLGVVDMNGPKVTSQTSTVRIRAAVAGFPVAKMFFNEPIDCSHPDLQATILQANDTTIRGRTEVYCTAGMRQLHVVLQLVTEEEVQLWNGVNIVIEVFGIRDIYGNLYGEEGTISSTGRRLSVADTVSMNFTGPEIPKDQGFDDSPWIVPNRSEYENELERTLEALLPTGLAFSSFHVEDEPIFAPSNVQPTGDNVGGIVGGSVAGVFAIAVLLAFAHYKNWLPTIDRRGKTEQAVENIPEAVPVETMKIEEEL